MFLMSKEFNRHFTKEGVKMANEHMKRCLIKLLIWEIDTKTAVRYHYIFTRMAKIKSLITPRVGDLWTIELDTFLVFL